MQADDAITETTQTMRRTLFHPPSVTTPPTYVDRVVLPSDVVLQ